MSEQVGDVVTVEVGGTVAQDAPSGEPDRPARYLGPTVVHLSGGYGIPMADLGVTAVIEVPFGVVVITQRHGIGGVHPAMYEQLGIDPSTYKIAVVKTASNFQWFAPLTHRGHTRRHHRPDAVGHGQPAVGTHPEARVSARSGRLVAVAISDDVGLIYADYHMIEV